MNTLYIGNMTGNSLDASDCVISEFDQSGFVKDFAHDSTPYPEALKSGLLFLRREIDRICCTSEGPSIDGIIRSKKLEAEEFEDWEGMEHV